MTSPLALCRLWALSSCLPSRGQLLPGTQVERVLERVRERETQSQTHQAHSSVTVTELCISSLLHYQPAPCWEIPEDCHIVSRAAWRRGPKMAHSQQTHAGLSLHCHRDVQLHATIVLLLRSVQTSGYQRNGHASASSQETEANVCSAVFSWPILHCRCL